MTGKQGEFVDIEKEYAYRQQTDLLQHLHFLFITDLQDLAYKCKLPCIQFNAKWDKGTTGTKLTGRRPFDVCQKFTHEPSSLVSVLHLLDLHSLQGTGDNWKEVGMMMMERKDLPVFNGTEMTMIATPTNAGQPMRL